MADVTVKQLEEFEAIYGGGFRRVRAGLGVSSFGLAVMDLPPNFNEYPDHDQVHDHQEEVYTLLSGRARLRVGGEGGEEHELEPGVWIRVGAAERRKIITGDEPARVLAVGGSPGRAYEPPEFTVEGGSHPPMDKHEY
jgi:mannose-6-phosphate isomerase-like protein (cupin superfamily)